MAEMKNLVFFSCTQCTHISTQMYTNNIKNKNQMRIVLLSYSPKVMFFQEPVSQANVDVMLVKILIF